MGELLFWTSLFWRKLTLKPPTTLRADRIFCLQKNSTALFYCAKTVMLTSNSCCLSALASRLNANARKSSWAKVLFTMPAETLSHSVPSCCGRVICFFLCVLTSPSNIFIDFLNFCLVLRNIVQAAVVGVAGFPSCAHVSIDFCLWSKRRICCIEPHMWISFLNSYWLTLFPCYFFPGKVCIESALKKRFPSPCE